MKKIIACILTAVMLASASAWAGSTDLRPGKQTEAVSVLCALHIMRDYGDGTFRPELLVTRGEFASILVKVIGAQPVAGEAPPFSDISVTDAGSGAVAAVAALGLMSGYPDKTFRPDREITAGEAVKTLVSALGYDARAQSVGGYPAGYYQAAKELGLLTGLGSLDGALSRGDAAMLVFHGLTAKRLKVVSYGKDSILAGRDGSTLLNDVFGVKTVMGIMTANTRTNAFNRDNKRLKADEFEVEGYRFTYPARTDALVGRQVKVYARMDDGHSAGDRGEAIHVLLYQTQQTLISAEQLSDASTKNTLRYFDEESNREHTVNLHDDCPVVYNGQYYSNLGSGYITGGMMKHPYGEIVLVDNGLDGEIDVIFINHTQIYIADAINTTVGLLYDKLGKAPLVLDPEGEKDTVLLQSHTGAALAWEDIREYDVLKVSMPMPGQANARTGIVRLETDTVKGYVTALGGDTVTVGYNEYRLRIPQGDEQAPDPLRTGDYVTACLDDAYRVVYWTAREAVQYGCLLGETMGKGLSGALQLRIFSFKSAEKVFSMARRVTMYDYSQSAAPGVYSMSGGSGSGSVRALYDAVKGRRGLIRYELNDEGQITLLAFPGVDSFPGNLDKIPSGEGFYKNYEKSNAYYINSAFDSVYRVTKNTKVIRVPEDLEDAEGYEVLSSGSFYGDRSYPVEIYGVNDRFEAAVVVTKKASREAVYDKKPSVVEGISDTLAKDGSQVRRLHLRSAGKAYTADTQKLDLACDPGAAEIFGYEGTKIGDLAPGDVIHYSTDRNGMIQSFSLAYRPGTRELGYSKDNYGISVKAHIPHTGLVIAYTQVKEVLPSMLVVDVAGYKPVVNAAGRSYYIFKDGKLTAADEGEVRKGDQVLLVWCWSTLTDIIIAR